MNGKPISIWQRIGTNRLLGNYNRRLVTFAVVAIALAVPSSWLRLAEADWLLANLSRDLCLSRAIAYFRSKRFHTIAVATASILDVATRK